VRVERAHSRARDTHTPLKNSIFDYLIFWATFRLGFFRFPNPNKRPFRRRDKEKGKKKKKRGEKHQPTLFERHDVGFFRFLPHRKNIDAGVVSSLSASFAFEQARTVSYTSRPVS